MITEIIAKITREGALTEKEIDALLHLMEVNRKKQDRFIAVYTVFILGISLSGFFIFMR